MYRLMIVDDEQVEREALQLILAKGFPELAVRQAVNGRTAIELAGEWRPDLIMMDIKMPGVDGLQAAERILEKQPNIKFIMVTAFDTFEYARSALRLQVKDYLLKPSKSSDIVEIVGKVLDSITVEHEEHERRVRQSARLQQLMPIVEADLVTQLLFDHVHDVHLSEMLGLLGRSDTREAFVLLLTVSNTDLQSGPEWAAIKNYYAAVKAKISESGSGFVGAISSGQVPIILFREEEHSYRSQAAIITRQLITLQQTPGRIDIFAGIGGPYDSLEHIRLSYQEALIASADRTLSSKHRLFCDVPPVSELENLQYTKRLEKTMIEQARLGDWEAVNRSIDELIKHYETCGAAILLAQQRVLEALWVVSRVAQELGGESEMPIFSFQVTGYRQLRSETTSVLEKTARIMTAHRNKAEPDVVSQIKVYITRNAHKDISLEMIAEQVNLNPYYISKIFKEQMGVNYIDFLTECRMEKAKALMVQQEASLKEITFEVGYKDPNYFSRVFKKMTGLSPTDYRKAMLGK